MTGKNSICYRYVEASEWQDYCEVGQLRAGDNSCGEGKWFALRAQDAWQWGRHMDVDFPGRVLVLEFPEGLLNRCEVYERLDSIGPAFYLEEEDLHSLLLVEVLEVFNETTEA